MSDAQIFYVALGSNVGDRERFLSEARAAIAALPETLCVGETPVEETAPLGPVVQGPFLNQMMAIKTRFRPEELLEELQAIEESAGRKRGERWGPRTVDLDIVALEGAAVSSPRLVVPHPELPNREFWLRELALLRKQVAKDD